MLLKLVSLLVLVLATLPSPQEVALSTEATLEGSLATGDTVVYVVEAGSEYFVRGFVDQVSVDVVVRILGPDEETLREIDGPARGPEMFQFETDEAGTYRIEVSPFEEETGDYSISLERLEPVATDPTELADQLLSVYDGEDSPGAVVSVFRNGETVFQKAYGMANLTYGIPFEVDTKSNIGSTSKQFTAFAVMLLVERGELSLDDDVREHIPELPDLGETVTVRNLLSHTSGYREFLNLLTMTGRRLDHGDFVDRAEVIDIIQSQPALQNSPGAEWNYNNSAFSLAAVIVERISGQDFHEFLAENLFEPLGMDGTMVRPSPEHIVEGSAMGYGPAEEGTFLELRDLWGAAGAGSIYSTVGDLQKWVENYADPYVGSAEIVQEMTTPFVLTDGEPTEYGLGLFIDEQRGLKRIHHGGADIAHRSMLAYYPEIGGGITTQSNHAGFDSNLAFRLAEAFFEDAMEPEEEEAATASDFDPATYDPEDFDEFVGRYALDAAPDFILTFSREDETFYTQATGQQQLEIVPTSDTTFTLLAVEASVEFHRNDDGEVDSLTLNQGGAQRATRLEDEEEWEPTVEDLAAFTGRYFSQEVETFFTVTLEEDHLVLQQRRLEDAELTPGATDNFSGGGLQVSFERDRNGQVIALYLANGRTRGVRFERVD